MAETVKAIVKHRRKTASEWDSLNPVLYAGEIGIETDTNKIKIGDGDTDWENLPYFGNDINLGYKEYVSLLSYDSGTQTITNLVLKTDFNTIVVTNPQTNVFLFTLAGVFTENKTIVISGNSATYFTTSYRLNSDSFVVQFIKHDGTTNTIGTLSNISIMVRVYD